MLTGRTEKSKKEKRKKNRRNAKTFLVVEFFKKIKVLSTVELANKTSKKFPKDRGTDLKFQKKTLSDVSVNARKFRKEDSRCE